MNRCIVIALKDGVMTKKNKIYISFTFLSTDCFLDPQFFQRPAGYLLAVYNNCACIKIQKYFTILFLHIILNTLLNFLELILIEFTYIQDYSYLDINSNLIINNNRFMRKMKSRRTQVGICPIKMKIYKFLFQPAASWLIMLTLEMH